MCTTTDPCYHMTDIYQYVDGTAIVSALFLLPGQPVRCKPCLKVVYMPRTSVVLFVFWFFVLGFRVGVVKSLHEIRELFFCYRYKFIRDFDYMGQPMMSVVYFVTLSDPGAIQFEYTVGVVSTGIDFKPWMAECLFKPFKNLFLLNPSCFPYRWVDRFCTEGIPLPSLRTPGKGQPALVVIFLLHRNRGLPSALRRVLSPFEMPDRLPFTSISTGNQRRFRDIRVFG